MGIHEDAKQIIDRHDKKDAWRANNELNALIPDGKKRAEVLWDLHRQQESLGWMGVTVAYMMALEGVEYSADDLLGLLEEFAAAFPDGKRPVGGYFEHLWHDGDLPGVFSSLVDLVRHRAHDPAFCAELAEGWKDLDAPYDQGLAYVLAHLKIIPCSALPASLLGAAIHKLAEQSSAGYWASMLPWPPEVFGPAVLAHVRKTGTSLGEGLISLLQVGGNVFEPAELVELLEGIPHFRLSYRVVELLPLLAEPRHGLPDQREALLAEVEARMPAQVGKMVAPAWSGAVTYPAFYLGALYLALGQRLGRAYDPKWDGFFAEMFDKFVMSWSGSYVEKLREVFAAIPRERLSKMFVEASTFHWSLAYAAPTEEVAERALVELTKNASSFNKYSLNDQVKPALVGCGEAAVAPLARRLASSGGPRAFLAEVLAELGAPSALPTLIALLGDKSKGVRDSAIGGLMRLPADQVLAALQPCFKAKRKDERLAAAEALASLPASPERLAAVRALLAADSAGELAPLLGTLDGGDESAAGGSAGMSREEVLAALEGSSGAEWEPFKALGADVLVEWYADYLERACKPKNNLSRYGEGEHWEELLAWATPTERAVAAFVRTLPMYRDWDARTTLGGLGAFWPAPGSKPADEGEEGTPAPETLAKVAREVSKRLAEGKWHRPKTAGKPGYGPFDEFDALKWLLEAQPEQASAALAFYLGDDRVKGRERVVEFLGARGGEAQAEALLLAGLKDGRATARATAAQVLGAMGAGWAKDALKAALEAEQDKKTADALRAGWMAAGGAADELASLPLDASGDQTLDARLAREIGAEQPAQKLPLAQAPSVRWRTGAALSPDALRWVVVRATQEGEARADAMLRAVRARLDDHDCEQLCAWLIKEAKQDEHGWPLYMQAVLASAARMEELGSRLEGFSRSQRHGWGAHGVEVLARAGTPEAVRWLDHWARKTRSNALKKRAPEGLAQLARRRGVSVEELVDGALPTLGFGADGRQVVDYGPRQFIAVLGADGEVSFTDAAGKPVKALPAPAKSDDPVLAPEAKARAAHAKKEAKRLIASQAERLELAMASGRAWPQAAWRARFQGHPLVRAVAWGLVFEHLGDDGAATPFVLGDGEALLGADGAALALPEGGHVRVAHPAAMDEAAREALDKLLLAQKRHQPFEQLLRRVFRPSDVDTSTSAWLLALPKTTDGHFLGALSRLHYDRGRREDAGLIFGSSKKFGAYELHLSHYGVSPEYVEGSRSVDITSASLTRDGEDLALAEAPACVFSEVIREVRILLGA